MNKKHLLVEAAGWYGVIAILTAYVAVNFHWMSAQHPHYQILNLTGAIGIIIDAWAAKNWQPAVLNLIWALVAIVGLINAFTA